MRIIGWIFGIPLATVILVFSIANRGDVTIDLWPLPITANLPVYLIGLGGLALGILLCVFTLGIAAFWWRVRAKHGERKLTALQKEMSALQEKLDDLQKPPPVLSLPNPDRKTTSQ